MAAKSSTKKAAPGKNAPATPVTPTKGSSAKSKPVAAKAAAGKSTATARAAAKAPPDRHRSRPRPPEGSVEAGDTREAGAASRPAEAEPSEAEPTEAEPAEAEPTRSRAHRSRARPSDRPSAPDRRRRPSRRRPRPRTLPPAATKSTKPAVRPADARQPAPQAQVQQGRPRLHEGLRPRRSSRHSTSMLQQERIHLTGQAKRLEDEAHQLIEDAEMGDVQFDDEGGEGDTMVVERERDLALSAQARRRGRRDRRRARAHQDGTYGYSVMSGRADPEGAARGDPVVDGARRGEGRRHRPPLTVVDHGARPRTRLAWRVAPLTAARSRRSWSSARPAHQVVGASTTLDDRNIDVFWTLRFNLVVQHRHGVQPGPRARARSSACSRWSSSSCCCCRCGAARSRLVDVAVGLIIGGALGNVIDRLFRAPGWLRGGVVDFIDFQWFPIFNVADMAITIGGGLLVLASWRAGRADDRSGPEPDRIAPPIRADAS